MTVYKTHETKTMIKSAFFMNSIQLETNVSKFNQSGISSSAEITILFKHSLLTRLMRKYIECTKLIGCCVAAAATVATLQNAHFVQKVLDGLFTTKKKHIC